MTKMRRFGLGLLASIVLGSSAGAASELVAERVKKLTRAVQWRQVAAIPMNFNTFHPQGMVKIGDTLFVSSVDIKTPTKRYPAARPTATTAIRARASGICSSSTSRAISSRT